MDKELFIIEPFKNCNDKKNIKSKYFFSKIQKKSSCIIINAGSLSEELYYDEKINSYYDFFKFSKVYSQKTITTFSYELSNFDYILFDHSGEANFIEKDLIESINQLKLSRHARNVFLYFFDLIQHLFSRRLAGFCFAEEIFSCTELALIHKYLTHA